MSQSYETLLLERRGRVAIITINRPEKRNALNIKTREEGAAALGLRGETLDPAALPAAFSRLTPAEIEDCLCIYKDAIRSVDRARSKSARRVVGARRPC